MHFVVDHQLIDEPEVTLMSVALGRALYRASSSLFYAKSNLRSAWQVMCSAGQEFHLKAGACVPQQFARTLDRRCDFIVANELNVGMCLTFLSIDLNWNSLSASQS